MGVGRVFIRVRSEGAGGVYFFVGYWVQDVMHMLCEALHYIRLMLEESLSH